VRLRANREEVLLPDSHGQIWNELVALAQHDHHLFHGNAKEVEQQMSQQLGLHDYDKFPTKRLGTLWRNDQWRPIITELCQFPFGQNLFSISTFEWLSSCRLNDVSVSARRYTFSFFVGRYTHHNRFYSYGLFLYVI